MSTDSILTMLTNSHFPRDPFLSLWWDNRVLVCKASRVPSTSAEQDFRLLDEHNVRLRNWASRMFWNRVEEGDIVSSSDAYLIKASDMSSGTLVNMAGGGDMSDDSRCTNMTMYKAADDQNVTMDKEPRKSSSWLDQNRLAHSDEVSPQFLMGTEAKIEPKKENKIKKLLKRAIRRIRGL